jgi:sulfonate transport system substrate-binding protein
MRWIFRLFPAILALIVLGALTGSNALGLTARPHSSAAPDRSLAPVKIRMGYSIPADDLKYLMKNHPELLKNAGKIYVLDWFQFAGVAPGVQALAAGTIDAGTVSPLAMANALSQGADFVVTAQIIADGHPGFFATPYVVKADSPIQKVEDLKGKVRATAGIGGSSYFAGKIMLTKHGLTEGSDYQVIEVPYPLMAEAINSGKANVGELVQPYFALAKKQGINLRPLFTQKDVIGETPVLLLAWRRDFYNKYPRAIQAFMDDWVRASRFMLDPKNRAAVLDATAQETKVDKSLLLQYLFTKDDYWRPVDGKIDTAGIQRNWNFLRQIGLVKPTFRVTGYVVTRYTEHPFGKLPPKPTAK